MTTVVHNQLVNPATGTTYTWAMNHSGEDLGSTARQIEDTAPALSGWQKVKPTRQQGAVGPLTMRLSGTILDPQQHAQFLAFTSLSQHQSVIFRCFDGTAYEVLIDKYSPTRKYVAGSSRGSHWIWTYTLELEVINTL